MLFLSDNGARRRTRNAVRNSYQKNERRFGGGGKGGGGSDALAQQQAAQQAAIQQGMNSINNTFDSTFTQPFYDNYQQSYLNYYQPQLADQYATAQQQLTYALADSGGLNSSAGAYQQAQLQKQYNQDAQMVQDNALGAVNTLKGNVQSARNTLAANLNASGNASDAASQAAAQASLLTAPQTYQPLGQLFTNIAQQAANQSSLNRLQAYGLSNRGVSGTQIYPTTSSVSVTN